MKIEMEKGQPNTAIETGERTKELISEIEQRLVANWFGVEVPNDKMTQKWVFDHGSAFDSVMFDHKEFLTDYAAGSPDEKDEIVRNIEAMVHEGGRVLEHKKDDRLDNKPTTE